MWYFPSNPYHQCGKHFARREFERVKLLDPLTNDSWPPIKVLEPKAGYMVRLTGPSGLATGHAEALDSREVSCCEDKTIHINRRTPGIGFLRGD